MLVSIRARASLVDIQQANTEQDQTELENKTFRYVL